MFVTHWSELLSCCRRPSHLNRSTIYHPRQPSKAPHYPEPNFADARRSLRATSQSNSDRAHTILWDNEQINLQSILENTQFPLWHYCAFRSPPPYNTPSCEDVMPFSIRPFHRFPVQCSVTYNAGPFQHKARSGISPIPAGDYPVICPCDQGKYYRS